MATFSKEKLSSSTDGRGILVTPTVVGSAETIHTGSATATTRDEIWIYAYNSHSAVVDLTICWGGTTDPDDLIKQTIPLASAGSFVGPIPVVEGLIIVGNATPLVVKAFASVADKVSLFGYVNRIAA
jgi:hypothetical protein